jgi:6-pyruvoyltetrahydropterin/6-carboxytetrahydropterin synthase
MIDLTRVYRFSSSHRLHSDQLSEDDNWQTYGKCNNPYGHGHNYEMEITVTGRTDPKTGLVVDVVSKYHMRNMNLDLSEYQSLVPTTENVALVIAGQLCQRWAGFFGREEARLKRVRIHETGNNIFEVHVSKTE